ncbi:hypothetical protein BKI52_30320 [marine bacterium AO1-C]|nr:hypothetical protein BKI52_30320 [marine bacterium AO1-C]
MNISFLKNYNALALGGIITIILIILINVSDGFNHPAYIPKSIHTLVNVLSFVFCWLLTTFLIDKYSFYKVLGVLSLLAVAMVAERNLDDQDNPVTIPLIILFWLGVTYLILPQFFNKYKVAILSVYGLVISYYIIYGLLTTYGASNRVTFAKFMIIPIPAFAALWGYEQWRWLKMLKADKANAELALLKSQINPHFFFNTLNNLYGLVVEKSDKAPEVVLMLSDMMRYTIYEGKEDLVLLKDEISYLENYIELHKIRYRKKVDIRFTQEVEGGLKVAPLLFIILLENAFKHGVEKTHDDAFIHMRMQTHNNQLFFTIVNNIDEPLPDHKPGIGLENLKKRLAHLYHNEHKLTIEATDSTYKVYLNLELT